MEKWQIPRLGQRKYEMSVEYRVVPEIKKILENPMMHVYEQNQQNELSMSKKWNSLNNKINNTVLSHNPK